MTTVARKDFVYFDEDGTRRTSKNDIYWSAADGGFAMTQTDMETCQQILEAVIKTVKGEIQVNTGIGIPYFTTVFHNPDTIEFWADAVRESVLGLSFISEIVSFEYDMEYEPIRQEHKLRYVLTVRTRKNIILTVQE